MMNHRLLHGRTAYDANETIVFYKVVISIMTVQKENVKHLKRKFNIS